MSVKLCSIGLFGYTGVGKRTYIRRLCNDSSTVNTKKCQFTINVMQEDDIDAAIVMIDDISDAREHIEYWKDIACRIPVVIVLNQKFSNESYKIRTMALSKSMGHWTGCVATSKMKELMRPLNMISEVLGV